MGDKARAPRNRTLTLSASDVARLSPGLLTLDGPVGTAGCDGRTIHGDCSAILDYLPHRAFDLVIADPPYNMTKSFNGTVFNRVAAQDYEHWLRAWLTAVRERMTATASIYICSEWRTSSIVQSVAQDLFNVRNRITWEREKGRGANANWKNASEDIWFCTMSDDYVFNVESVKLKRRVLAPYRHQDGRPNDWQAGPEGDFRETHPSNLWTDLTVPFWSMPENTDHPTQKPEKLIAKLILASSRPGQLILDPFLGSGTTSVVAAKLGRRFVGIEIEREYCLLAERRLELAKHDPTIQGYVDGVFWDRNTLPPVPGRGSPVVQVDVDSQQMFELVPTG